MFESSSTGCGSAVMEAREFADGDVRGPEEVFSPDELSEMRKGFCARILQVKEERGMSYAQLATACGTSIDTMRRLALGGGTFHLDTIFMFCERMGVSADWLLWGEERSS